MSDDLRVREATLDDRAAIGALWRELMDFHKPYDRRFRHMKPNALDVWLEHLDECMTNDDHIILVAEAGSELVAFAMARPGEDPPVFDVPPHVFVTNFSVTAEWRRRGLGQRLFEGIAERAGKRGFGEVRLSVAAENPFSNAFWRQMGFEPHAVHLRKGL
ncbi:MAG TPA: GNAT family N-acetyltransferase [Armatimonadota bacterium]|nr:GNAT family N-acetyltransferase [Armatimonadota bacterium]